MNESGATVARRATHLHVSFLTSLFVQINVLIMNECGRGACRRLSPEAGRRATLHGFGLSLFRRLEKRRIGITA
jgi:hypothetical protein